MTMRRAQVKRRDAARIRQLCDVPEPLTVTQWADKYRQLPETSTSPGKYDSAVTPYIRRPQDCMGDPGVEMVVLCFGAQLAKSTAIENAIGYRIHRMPSPIVVVQPKIDSAEAWAKERFVPMVKSTPVLRERVQLGRSTDSTLRYKVFPGGFLFAASAQSASELAARSAPTVGLDEVDRMEALPQEGSPVEIVLRRQGAADLGTAFLTSTPGTDEDTIIYPYLEGGTFERYFVPCPHCGHRQHLVWGNIDLETASYVCGSKDAEGKQEGCGVLIDERFKPAMLAAGEWRASNPDGKYPSFHLNALYSPFAKSNWAAAVAAWRRAQGKPADLQVFVNTWLAELWKESGEQLASDHLLARLESGHTEGEVPAGVGALTLGVDVQADRIEWWVWGWGAGLESWPIAAGVITGDPEKDLTDPKSPWVQLEREVIDHDYPHANGETTLRIHSGFIDSGYATSSVYKVCKRWKGRRIVPSKGVGGGGVPICGKPSYMKHAGISLYPVGTDNAKSEFLRSQLRELQVGPGFVHLPDWLDSGQVAQFVAEKRIRRMQRGQPVYEWRKKSADERNEALDCRVYARAALELLGVKFLRALGTKAAVKAGTAVPITAAPPPPAPSYAEQVRAAKISKALRRGRPGGWTSNWKRY
jgi:phage terminase large subunit GpA-like protein